MFYNIYSFTLTFNKFAKGKTLLSALMEHCDIDPRGVGSLIGTGVQGETWDYVDDTVIKIQVSNTEDVPSIVEDLNFIKNNTPEVYPRVYHAQVICDINDPEINIGLTKGTAYYYIMDKLLPLDSQKAEDLAKILNAKDRNQELPDDVKNSPYLEEAERFLEKLKASQTLHLDIRPGNLMQTPSGELKMIDLDSVMVIRGK